MCGIAGYLAAESSDMLESMLHTIRHRGPDGKGIFIDHKYSVALGHRRLSIIDLEGGAQPIRNEDESVVIVCNGEIYNYKELRDECISRGHVFTTSSDSETILHGYEIYGEDVVHRLQGMFAFALWDKKKEHLFLARDRMGIKPLVYMQTKKGFFFASEQKALLPFISERKINYGTLIRYLLFGFHLGSETLLENVDELKPGEYAIIKNDKICLTRYWELTFEPSIASLSYDTIKKNLHDLLTESIASHMIADVPVGMTLSGGLDSSIIFRLAQHAHLEPLHTFTIGYGEANDEFPYARIAVAGTNALHHETITAFDTLTNELPEIIWHLDEPLPHAGIGSTFELARYLKNYLKVVLIGEGSDELFGGYIGYIIFQRFISFFLTPKNAARTFALSYLGQKPQAIQRIVETNILRDINPIEMYHREYISPIERYEGPLFQAVSAFELSNELPNNQLSRIDRLMMAHGIEARVPFLDTRFAEFAFSIPAKYKVKLMTEKFILRKSFNGDIPPEIIKRKKGGPKGTQSITNQWMKTSLLDKMRENLTKRRIQELGVFRWENVEYLLTQKTSNPLERRVNQKLLLFIYFFHIWHGLFIE